jgi:hypothetical protein
VFIKVYWASVAVGVERRLWGRQIRQPYVGLWPI